MFFFSHIFFKNGDFQLQTIYFVLFEKNFLTTRKFCQQAEIWAVRQQVVTAKKFQNFAENRFVWHEKIRKAVTSSSMLLIL